MPADQQPWRPSLARSIMLRYDWVREAELLLMPERVVLLNDEAGRVLRLCDGSRTTMEIVAELAELFPEAPVAEDVPEFLARVRAEGWLR